MKVFIGKRNSCGLNYQGDVVRAEMMSNYEIVDDAKEADIIIFPDTCCSTEYHTKYTIAYINKVLADKKPTAKTFVTGCISRHFTKKIDGYDIEEWLRKKIDYIVPQNKVYELLKLISEEDYKDYNSDSFGALLSAKDKSANIYISNGCRNNCSFCKTNYQEYPLKSIELDVLKEAIDYLDEKETKTVTLRGTNVSQYGLDLYNEYKLPEIIEYIDSKENIESVNFVGFAYKDAIKHGFADTMRDSKKIDEISGSLESGSDRLLKLIRKGFTSQEIIDFVNEIKKKYERRLRLNVISGFPTETMDDIKKTLEVLKELNPNIIDLCRYTNSKIVDSNNYPQLTPNEIEEHTRVYSKVLRRRGIKTNINGNGYKFN